MKKLEHNHLAEGETTGHFHAAEGGGVALYEKDADTLVLEAPEGCDLTHQEHKTLAVPPGTYERYGVQERDHIAEQTRRVRD